MKIPAELRYTEDHEWLRPDGGNARVGITHFAQDQLGDIVFVELPAVGRKVTKGETFGVVESVKSVSDLFSPVTGTVKGVNQELVDHPELINQDPYGQGWIIDVELANPSDVAELLTADSYAARQEEGH